MDLVLSVILIHAGSARGKKGDVDRRTNHFSTAKS
jgi:hypothetical protein